MIRLIFSVLLTISAPVFAQDAEHTISVTGVGAVTTVPDIAQVSLGVSTDARTAREALLENSKAMQGVMDVLAAEGVLPADVQTSNLSLFPNYENRNPGRPPSVVGYRAQNMLAITIRDVDGLGRILDSVSSAGSNLIQSISFSRDNTEDLANETRIKAVQDARKKAELYAEAAGVTLGQVISISEVGGGSPRSQNMARAQMETMAMDVPMAQGEVSLRISVHMVFLIE